MEEFKFKIEWFEEIDSTNKYLKRKKFETLNNGDSVIANYQLEGKGQRNNTWKANHGENLLFSFYLRTKYTVENPIALLQIVSISICKCIEELTGITCAIKWPNDIVAKNKKIAGILIENTIQGSFMHTIIGIGVNLNQEKFEDFSTPATSVKVLSGEKLDAYLVLSVFENIFSRNYYLFQTNQLNTIHKKYLNKLYSKGKLQQFEILKTQELVNGKILTVDELGRLVIDFNGVQKAFLNGEIKYIF